MNRNKQTEVLGVIITIIILILLIFLTNMEVNKLVANNLKSITYYIENSGSIGVAGLNTLCLRLQIYQNNAILANLETFSNKI